MYIINKNINRIEQLKERSFSELGFRERDHLQEWVANEPEALGEELMIIQKEFAGFNDTNERLDLLALDKQGDLVIIENKLDDTGRDVTWQALKYASYCSTLSKEDIRKIFQNYLDKTGSNLTAEKKLCEFYENAKYEAIPLNKGNTQRIILIAANFRKEVTSTVLWLMNYKLRIQCFKATPYSLNDQILLNLEQIIPMKDVEEFMISMAEKVQDDIDSKTELKNELDIVRKEFWLKLIQNINNKSSLFQSITPRERQYLNAGAGLSGVSFYFFISRNYTRTGIYIERKTEREREFIFNELINKKSEIERSFGEELNWERLDNNKACRITSVIHRDFSEKTNWDEMIDSMTDRMIRIERSFKVPLQQIRGKLKERV